MLPPDNSFMVSTHSRPKAAGPVIYTQTIHTPAVSTHSRPKAAGPKARKKVIGEDVSTHSRPKAAGCRQLFTRRPPVVSTHSRPKAAGASSLKPKKGTYGFNSQPPEGGWTATAY